MALEVAPIHQACCLRLHAAFWREEHLAEELLSKENWQEMGDAAVLMWVQEEQQIHVFATSLPNQWSLQEVQYGHCCHRGWMKRPQYIRKDKTELCKKSIFFHVQKNGN